MRARTSVVVRPGGAVHELRCEPPLTLRRIRTDDPRTAALCLVGTSAGPLAGDDLVAELSVEADAAATLISTGASIAQGRRPERAASARWCVRVGEGARLVADPGALIACEGSRTELTVDISLAATAAIEWRELIVLGRSTDASAGDARLRWNVSRAGQPLLRQSVDLTGPGRDAPNAGHRVLGSTLLVDPGLAARTIVHDPTAVAARLAEHAVLITVLGDGAARVGRRLAALRAEFVAN